MKFQSLQRIHAAVLNFHEAWTARPALVYGVFLLIIVCALPAFWLRTDVQVSDLIDGESEIIRAYHEHTEIFPRQKNLVGVLNAQAPDTESLRRWLVTNVPAVFGDDACVTPVSVRRPFYEAETSRLLYPTWLPPDRAWSSADLRDFAQSPWGGLWGRDFGTLLISCRVNDELTGAEVETLMAGVGAPTGYAIRWTGDAVFDAFAEKGLARTNLLNFAGLIGLGLLVFALFGMWRAAILSWIAMLLGIGATLGLMSLFGQTLDILTSNLFLLLLIATVEDLFLIFFFSARKNQSLQASARELLIPSFYTSLTTAIGFGSLGVTTVPAIDRFALWTGVGVMLEWFLVFFVVVYLIPRWRSGGLRPTAFFRGVIHYADRIVLPRRLGWALIVPLAFTPFLFRELNFNSSPFEIFPKDHPVVTVKNEIRAARRWESFVELTWKGTLPDERRDAILSQVAGLGGVTWIEHPALLLGLERRGEGGLQDREIRELALGDLARTELGRRYRSSRGPERAFVYLLDSDMDAVRELRVQVETLCQGDCVLTGELVALGDYSRLIIRTLLESLALSIVSILVLIYFLMFATGQAAHWQHITISVLWGQGLLLYVFVITQTSVSLLSCILLSTVAGLSGDNAIQYLFNAREGELKDSVDEIGPSAVVMAIVAVALCVPWLFSDFGNVREVGALLILCLILMLFGDYVLLKGLLRPRTK